MMKPSLPLWMTAAALLTYSCGKAEDSEPNDPPQGLGGGDGDYVVPATGGNGGDGDGDGDGDVNVPPLQACVVSDDSPGLLYDDFDDSDGVPNTDPTGTWFDYSDGTSTQTPSWDIGSGWAPEAGGLTDSGYALHAVGEAFGEWGSGQGSVPAQNTQGELNCLYDASAFDGISFWIRGSILMDGSPAPMDTEVLKFGVVEADAVPVEEGGTCTADTGPCYDWHKTRVVVGECWQRYSFRFDDLEQDGWGKEAGELDMDKMINFAFEIAEGHTFDIWIDDVEFFVGETPPSEEVCDGLGGAGGGGN